MTTSNCNPAKVQLAICASGELYGGVERHIVGMCSWLHEHDRAPCLVLFYDRELAAQVRQLGIDPIVLAPNHAIDPKIPEALSTIFRTKQTNVVHCHGYRAVVNSAIALRHHSARLLRTVHGLPEPGPLFGMTTMKSRAYTWLEKYASAKANSWTTFVTNDLRDRQFDPRQALRTRTIYNGIAPLNRSDYKRPGDLEPGAVHLAAVGRVTQVKGLATAIRAVAQTGRDNNLVLNIIGTGPLVGDLIELTRQLDLAGRVRFLGFKNNVFEYFAHVDALVMPSLHEGLPYTVLEAMSMARPIIASRVGGLQEILKDGVTGRLLPPNDIGAWAQAFTAISRDKESVSQWGECAGRVQRESFTLDRNGALMWQLYEEILSQDLRSKQIV